MCDRGLVSAPPQSSAAAAAFVQSDLGFRTDYDVIPIPGRPDLFQIRTRQTALHGMASLTIRDVSDELRIPRRTVQRLCEKGLLKSYRPAQRDRKILRRDLDAYKRERGIP